MSGLFYVGLATLAIGVLIFFAVRSQNGGLAGILLSGVFSWLLFEGTWTLIRAINDARVTVAAQHRIAGGCLGAILLCGIGGFWVVFGSQIILGVVFGGIVTFINHRGMLANWSQALSQGSAPAAGSGGQSTPVVNWSGLIGLTPIPSPERSVPLSQHTWAKLLAGLLGLLVGFVFFGFGAFRFLESSTVLGDVGCTHPCGMMRGVWMQVMRDSQGEVVTRIDSTTVQLRMRFWDDVPGDQTISRTDFALKNALATFEQVSGRPGCDAWSPRKIRIDGNINDLTLCFTISQADNVDLNHLYLVWSPRPDWVAEIPLCKVLSAACEIVLATPSPSPR